MQFRVAIQEDLLEIKSMYLKIIDKMKIDDIKIWDNIYPCEFFDNDIKNKNLYLLLKNNIIVGAFALCKEHSGANAVKWEQMNAKAVYIDRLGVNIDFCKQGIATELLKAASNMAIENNAEYLRLFVIDFNIPAKNLYEKFGFKQVEGVYKEVIDETLSFDEFGYEIKL